MLSIQPIREQDVLELLNAGRFAGDVEGYVMMDGQAYLGCALFLVEGGVTTVLDCDVEEPQMLDGAVRACVAAGEHRGAGLFAVNTAQPRLERWWELFCKGTAAPVPTARIFGHCG